MFPETKNTMARKTAIITGATKGIGKAIAEKLLQEDYDIAICARNQSDLTELKKAWGKQFPESQVFTLSVDLGKEEEVIEFAEKVAEFYPKVDVLVNNAGVFIPGTVLEEAEDALKTQLQINVLSAHFLSQYFGKKMMEARQGNIINICSIASLGAYAGGSSYSISKYAMLGMSDNFRAALKPFGVKVTAICPGPTRSASWEGTGVDEKKLMPAEDIAALAWQCIAFPGVTSIDRIVVDTNAVI